MSELWDILNEKGEKTGGLHERGKPMREGEYHLVVHVWIINDKGEFLISKRTPDIGWGGLWQTTGGSAVAGDGSLATALKETREEVGITLDPNRGRLFKRYSEPHKNDKGGAIYDVWLFNQNVDISSVRLQPEETCDAGLARKDDISRMMDEGSFIPREAYPYIDDLFMAAGE